jgi:hypothetical protein
MGLPFPNISSVMIKSSILEALVAPFLKAPEIPAHAPEKFLKTPQKMKEGA